MGYGSSAYGEGAYGEAAWDEATWDEAEWSDAPAISLKAVLDFGGATDDGRLIRAVAVPWFEIVRMLQQDPASLYQIDPFKWEEIIAGAYKKGWI